MPKPTARPLRASAGSGAYRGTPPAFAKRSEALLVVPRRQVFGSEELSSRSPVIAGLIPEARLFVSVPDAARLGLAEGSMAKIEFETAT